MTGTQAFRLVVICCLFSLCFLHALAEKPHLLEHGETEHIVQILDMLTERLRNEYFNRKDTLVGKLSKLQDEKSSAQGEYETLDEQRQVIEAKISQKTGEIEELTTEIHETESTLDTHNNAKEHLEAELELIAKIRQLLLGGKGIHSDVCSEENPCHEGLACEEGLCVGDEGRQCDHSDQCLSSLTCQDGTCKPLVSSCNSILRNYPHSSSGTYEIVVQGKRYPVYCDMSTGGGGWTRFWWYNGEHWPSNETDALGRAFGAADPSESFGFQRMPTWIEINKSKLLAKDGRGNVYRWTFTTSIGTSQRAFNSFRDRVEYPFTSTSTTGNWDPEVLSGSFHGWVQRCWQYRKEGPHGVKSFMLDDDYCDCRSTLSVGHGVCRNSHNPSYSQWGALGVDILNDDGCRGPVPNESLELYFKEEI